MAINHVAKSLIDPVMILRIPVKYFVFCLLPFALSSILGIAWIGFLIMLPMIVFGAVKGRKDPYFFDIALNCLTTKTISSLSEYTKGKRFDI